MRYTASIEIDEYLHVYVWLPNSILQRVQEASVSYQSWQRLSSVTVVATLRLQTA